MNSDYWRRGVAAVLTAGLLTAGAVAQDGASGEVEIEDKAPVTAKKDSVVKAKKVVKPEITDRDPFVNSIASGDVVGTVGGRRTSASSGGSTVKAASDDDDLGDDGEGFDEDGDGAGVEEPEVVEILAPEVTVNGIVGSGSGRQAIVVDAAGATHIVRAGQKIGEVYVSSVASKSVTFVHQGKAFNLPMASEFGE